MYPVRLNAISLWICKFFSPFEFTISFENSLSLSRIHYLFPGFTIYLANLLWIHYLFREYTMASLINRVLTHNVLFLPRIYYGFFIFIANSLSIHYLFGKFTMDQLFFWRTSLWIHYFFRVFTLNLLYLSRIHHGSMDN